MNRDAASEPDFEVRRFQTAVARCRPIPDVSDEAIIGQNRHTRYAMSISQTLDKRLRELAHELTDEDLLDAAAVLADYDTRSLSIADLDFNSAAHPCVLSHTVYGTLGYDWKEKEYPIFAKIGASY